MANEIKINEESELKRKNHTDYNAAKCSTEEVCTPTIKTLDTNQDKQTLKPFVLEKRICDYYVHRIRNIKNDDSAQDLKNYYQTDDTKLNDKKGKKDTIDNSTLLTSLHQHSTFNASEKKDVSINQQFEEPTNSVKQSLNSADVSNYSNYRQHLDNYLSFNSFANSTNPIIIPSQIYHADCLTPINEFSCDSCPKESLPNLSSASTKCDNHSRDSTNFQTLSYSSAENVTCDNITPITSFKDDFTGDNLAKNCSTSKSENVNCNSFIAPSNCDNESHSLQHPFCQSNIEDVFKKMNQDLQGLVSSLENEIELCDNKAEAAECLQRANQSIKNILNR